MRLNQFQVNLLIEANRHANVMGVLERNHEYQNWHPLAKAMGAEDGFNWAAVPVAMDNDPVIDEFLIASGIQDRKKIINAATAGCGYGSRQAAVETEFLLYVQARTCGGHWVEVWLFGDGTVDVACDSRPSHRNWGDYGDAGSGDISIFRLNRLVEDAISETKNDIASCNRGIGAAKAMMLSRAAAAMGSAAVRV